VRLHRQVTDAPAQTILNEAVHHDLVILGATAAPLDRSFVVGAEWPMLCWPTHTHRWSSSNECVPLPYPLADEMAGAGAISILVDKWFAENTFRAEEFADLCELVAIKQRKGLTVSLALPALNEEETVGKVVTTIKQALVESFRCSTRSF
jgi:hypothetical protein